jgi:MFS family permease
MRRLVVLVSAIVLVDTMLYAALTPLLPAYSEEFGLSKGGAGALVAAYAVGVLLGAFPAGIAASWFGAKPASLAGLVVIGLASIGFAYGGDPWTLGTARFLQGVGSALSWAGGLAWLIAASERNRRGQLLGTALGAAVFGALLGPVVGGIASVVGTGATFSAVGMLAVLVAGLGLRQPGVPCETPSLAAVGRAFRERRFVGGLWLMLLPALLFGILSVLASLDLDRLGWSAIAIGALFFTTAAIETFVNPWVGRVVDRRGALSPVRVALPLGAVGALALAWADRPWLIALLALGASIAWGALFTPGMALLSRGADLVGLAQAQGFGLMSAAWATGAIVGPALGGALADVMGDPAVYTLAAGACTLTAVATTLGAASGTLTTRVPENP